jgi:hypothetical protein
MVGTKVAHSAESWEKRWVAWMVELKVGPRAVRKASTKAGSSDEKKVQWMAVSTAACWAEH